MSTLNEPRPTPATRASSIPDGPPPPSSILETRTTATIASAIPTRTSDPGIPSVMMPATTGMTAAMTPVTGATIPIRPIASPRYSAVMPAPPASPAATLSTTSVPVGSRFGSDDGDDQGHRHPDELGEQDDAQKRRPTRQETATEVAGSPRDRRHETEDDRRRLGREDVAQVLRLEPARAAPPAGVGCRAVGAGPPISRAVGPTSSTTRSAASSYRDDVVR